MIIQDQPKREPLIPESVGQSIREFLDLGIHFGEGDKSIDITIGLILMLILAFVVTTIGLRWIRKLATRKLEENDQRKFISIFQFLKYAIYLVVILITMSAAGINITILITASAALFVGLGLALQELFQDVIGGIFIILDKSLHVGDVIKVDDKVGRVFQINLRTTRAVTPDDKVLVIPNHHFISDIIFNYTQNYNTTRESVRVGVAYGSDVQLVTKILLDCVAQEDLILKKPEPFVLFEDFGDSALIFSVLYYINDSFADMRIKSRVRYMIDEEFRKHKVVIPFPQRDVHLYATPTFPGPKEKGH